MALSSGFSEFRGFSSFEGVVRELGGIAARREILRRSPMSETDFWFALHYRRLDRIRQGWYGASNLPPDARAAWKAGGPLACVSALQHHGLFSPEGDAGEESLHICLAAGGRVGRDAPPDLVVHWSTADRYSGTRLAVSPPVALRQARSCRRRRAVA